MSAARRRNGAPVCKWIARLDSKGIRPIIRLISTTNSRDWKRTEKAFIKFYRLDGFKLLNRRDGGDGPTSGKVKRFCEKHRCQRVKLPSGDWRCLKCVSAHVYKWRKQNPGCRTNEVLKYRLANMDVCRTRSARCQWEKSHPGRKYPGRHKLRKGFKPKRLCEKHHCQRVKKYGEWRCPICRREWRRDSRLKREPRSIRSYRPRNSTLTSAARVARLDAYRRPKGWRQVVQTK